MLKLIQTSQHYGEGRAGVMIPIPQYPLYSATLSELNSYQVSKDFSHYLVMCIICVYVTIQRDILILIFNYSKITLTCTLAYIIKQSE